MSLKIQTLPHRGNPLSGDRYSMQMNIQHDRSKIEPMAGSNIRLALFVNRQAWNHHPTMLESIGKLDQ